MYERYEKGNLFQLDFGNGYGYVQEVGETVHKNGSKIVFVTVYERSFSEKIRKTEELRDEKYFTCRFYGIPSEKCRGTPNHPVNQTVQGSEFEYGTYKDERTGMFKKRYIYVKCLGLHPVPSEIEFPQYLRDPEYDFISGTHKWIVMTPYNEFVKQQKTAKGIEYLAPYLLNFITCAAWWEDGLTLETWDDEYCVRFIERHYLDFPEHRPVNMSFDEAAAAIPTKIWRENETDVTRLISYSKIEDALQTFVAELSPSEGKVTIGKTKKAVKKLCIELNGLQNETFFIETQEREELFIFISNLLRTKKMGSAIEVLEEYSDW